MEKTMCPSEMEYLDMLPCYFPMDISINDSHLCLQKWNSVTDSAQGTAAQKKALKKKEIKKNQ